MRNRQDNQKKQKLTPVKAKSLKDICTEKFEALILSGEFKVGERLPSERELAHILQVSRPVVHNTLVELAGKGLVTIRPRHGVIINDYRKEGSVELLLSLFNYNKTNGVRTRGPAALEPGLLKSLLEFRKSFETVIAGTAADRYHEDTHKQLLTDVLKKEKQIIRELQLGEQSGEQIGHQLGEQLGEQINKNLSSNQSEHHNRTKKHPKNRDLIDNDMEYAAKIAETDYLFHHTLALCTDNLIYPLLMNSFKNLYVAILENYYQNKPAAKSPPFIMHDTIIQCVMERNKRGAEEAMHELLKASEEKLYAYV